MATGTIKREGQGIARGACGTATGDGTALSVTLGFKPKSLKIVNLTDAIIYEKIDGMLDTQTIKTVTAGTMTIDTTSIVVLAEGGFVLAAAAFVNAKSFVWYAE